MKYTDTKRNDKRRESGMITVEGVLSLVPFILVIMGIISFINIFMVHNKMQYAIFQVGSELSAYTYFYEALGIRAGDAEFNNDADRETTEIDKTIADTTNLLGQLSTLNETVQNVGSNGVGGLETDLDNLEEEARKAKEAGQNAWESAKTLFSDPEDLIRNVVYLGLQEAEGLAKTFLLELIATSMIDNYLTSEAPHFNPMTADEYLKSMGVVNGMGGLYFDKSELFTDDENSMIDIVVEYDVEVFAYKLFFTDPTVHVVQRCCVPAWLDGDKHE